MACMQLIIDELMRTDRYVTTNLPLKLSEMSQCLHERYGSDFNLTERVRVLTDTEVLQYWLHPALHWEVTGKKMVASVGNREMQRPDFEPLMAWLGALIVIDEAPEYFDALRWAEVAEDHKYFLRQSRKLNVDVVYVCQAMSQVAKPLRDFAQETMVFRNLGYEFIGKFRAPNLIYWQRFFKTPQVSRVPMTQGTRKVDKAFLGKMYDSTAGVGMKGGFSADFNRKQKGLPLWLLVALVITGVCLLGSFPFLLRYFSGYYARRALRSEPAGVLRTNTPASPVQTNEVPVGGFSGLFPHVIAKPRGDTLGRVKSAVVAETNAVPDMVGYFRSPTGVWRIFLADGTSISSKDKRVERLEDGCVVVDGVRHYMRGAVGSNGDEARPETAAGAILSLRGAAVEVGQSGPLASVGTVGYTGPFVFDVGSTTRVIVHDRQGNTYHPGGGYIREQNYPANAEIIREPYVKLQTTSQ